jgi:hypothetical protein
MMQQMQQGLKVEAAKEMHMLARLAHRKQFVVSRITQEIQ